MADEIEGGDGWAAPPAYVADEARAARPLSAVYARDAGALGLTAAAVVTAGVVWAVWRGDEWTVSRRPEAFRLLVIATAVATAAIAAHAEWHWRHRRVPELEHAERVAVAASTRTGNASSIITGAIIGGVLAAVIINAPALVGVGAVAPLAAAQWGVLLPHVVRWEREHGHPIFAVRRGLFRTPAFRPGVDTTTVDRVIETGDVADLPAATAAAADLHHAGRFEESLTVSVALFERTGEAMHAYNAACSAARLRHFRDAEAWLHRALDAGFGDGASVHGDADFDRFRMRPEFDSIRARLT